VVAGGFFPPAVQPPAENGAAHADAARGHLMWKIQFGIAVAFLVAGFLLHSLAHSRDMIGVGEALMAGGVLAGGWLLVKRFIFRSYES
jgi:hypothetical protein